MDLVGMVMLAGVLGVMGWLLTTKRNRPDQ
jgi:hypothetical protein